MKLTEEQIQIVNSTGSIKINAVAGSGKTTTVIQYAKSRPAKSRILYLAFNKTVKLEAMRKFAAQGLHNVRVETAHSLAFRYVVHKYNYKVRAHGYKTNEIVDLLKLRGNEEKHTEYVIANHINKFITYFCNSDKERVQDLNYLDTITDIQAKAFVSTFYNYIVAQSRILLSKMDKGEIEVTHDFYLKKFQLSRPRLNYDYILFDEAQDASPAMLDIFFNQDATKVIVGDTHQQIYGWRFAVNSLEKADFQTFHLTTSFRFGQDIANLAMEVLKYKNVIEEQPKVEITGKGDGAAIGTRAVIARTNLALLLKAIEYVTEKKDIKQIYFEGNINSYTYADDGTSLYDVLNLYNKRHHLIRDRLIKVMKDLRELEEYIEKTEDVQLGMMVEIVKEYGNEIPGIIKTIKEKHVENEKRNQAGIIFSTVHRCKGMEYDTIELADDFINREKISRIKEGWKGTEVNPAKINEEINLLYVAVTRAKNSIHIPETLLPEAFPESPQINILKQAINLDEVRKGIPDHDFGESKLNKNEKSYSVDEVRAKHREAYKPWSAELDDELTLMYCEKIELSEMAKYFGRTKGAIISRIKKLELEELYG